MQTKHVLTLIVITLLAASAGADECFRIEAEDFSEISGSMELIHDPTAGGDGTTVGAPNGSGPLGADFVRYAFRPTADGVYYFRGRARTPTAADDSFCVQIRDAAGALLSPSYPGQCGGDTYWDFWVNPNWQVFELRNGWNTIPPSAQQIVYLNLQGGDVYSMTLRRRENGTRLDWLEVCRQEKEGNGDPDEEQALDEGEE